MLPARAGGLAVVDVGDGDLALDDFEEGEVGFTQTGTALDEDRTTQGDLTDSFGDHVDQDGRIFDNLRGLVNEVSSHRGKVGLGIGGRRIRGERRGATVMFLHFPLRKRGRYCLIGARF